MKQRGKKIGFSLSNLLPFLLAVLTYFLVEYGSNHPVTIEKYYSIALYPLVAAVFSSLSGLFPFSLWDLFWTLFVGCALVLIGMVIMRKIKPFHFLLRIAQTAAILYTFFYFS
jgi:hypothetical protein